MLALSLKSSETYIVASAQKDIHHIGSKKQETRVVLVERQRRMSAPHE